MSDDEKDARADTPTDMRIEVGRGDLAAKARNIVSGLDADRHVRRQEELSGARKEHAYETRDTVYVIARTLMPDPRDPQRRPICELETIGHLPTGIEGGKARGYSLDKAKWRMRAHFLNELQTKRICRFEEARQRAHRLEIVVADVETPKILGVS